MSIGNTEAKQSESQVFLNLAIYKSLIILHFLFLEFTSTKQLKPILYSTSPSKIYTPVSDVAKNNLPSNSTIHVTLDGILILPKHVPTPVTIATKKFYHPISSTATP